MQVVVEVVVKVVVISVTAVSESFHQALGPRSCKAPAALPLLLLLIDDRVLLLVLADSVQRWARAAAKALSAERKA